jgi:hypothetical protein
MQSVTGVWRETVSAGVRHKEGMIASSASSTRLAKVSGSKRSDPDMLSEPRRAPATCIRGGWKRRSRERRCWIAACSISSGNARLDPNAPSMANTMMGRTMTP